MGPQAIGLSREALVIRQGNRTLDAKQVERLVHAFSLIKAESDTLLAKDPRSIFVYTSVYRGIGSRRKCLVVGRTGVGKSALAQTYANLEREHFSQTVALQADKMLFDRICNLLFAGREAHAELKVGPDRVATIAWIRSIVLFATLTATESILRGDFKPSFKLSSDQEKLLLGARELANQEFSSTLGDPDTDSNGRFHSLIERALSFLSQLTRSLTEDEEEQSRIKGEQLKQFFDPLPPKLAPALTVIGHTGYRLLVTLDEFDDFVDSFMMHNATAQRKETLLSLLKGLVLAVKQLNREAGIEWLHLLIAVPEDKLLELWLRERATVDRFALKISWTPDELKDCIERRLSHVLGPETRWEDLFGFQVSNKNPVVKTKEQTFSYLVRHTNRKPRELMTHLRTLFQGLEGTDAKAADERAFHKAVEATNEQIVDDQFLPEYISEYPTLGQFFVRLQNSRLRTVMPYGELTHHLRNWRPWENDEILSPIDTMVRFFQMGVIGLREISPVATARTIRQLGAHVIYHFSFNGTTTQFFQGALKELAERDGAPRGAPRFELVFAPMFFEYLRLRHEQPYIINQLR